MNGRLLALAAIGALLLGGLAARGGDRRVVTDSAGRHVEIPARVERVFAAGAPASVAVYVVAPETLLGWALPLSESQRAYLTPQAADLQLRGRLTGRSNTASLESVIATRPDLIVDVGEVDDTYVSLADQVQRQTGIPYLIVAGRLDRTPQMLATLGDWLGRPERGRELSERAEAILADLRAGIAEISPDRRPRVYLARGPSGLETSLSGSINAELIELLGATNVAETTPATGNPQVSIEQILHWSPDVILALDPRFVAAIRDDAAWQSVPAVRNGRVYLAPELPFGWIDAPPSVNRLLGARWAAGVLYRDRFSDDIRPLVRDFFSRFYHVELDPERLGRLLDSIHGH